MAWYQNTEQVAYVMKPNRKGNMEMVLNLFSEMMKIHFSILEK